MLSWHHYHLCRQTLLCSKTPRSQETAHKKETPEQNSGCLSYSSFSAAVLGFRHDWGRGRTSQSDGVRQTGGDPDGGARAGTFGLTNSRSGGRSSSGPEGSRGGGGDDGGGRGGRARRLRTRECLQATTSLFSSRSCGLANERRKIGDSGSLPCLCTQLLVLTLELLDLVLFDADVVLLCLDLGA